MEEYKKFYESEKNKKDQSSLQLARMEMILEKVSRAITSNDFKKDNEQASNLSNLRNTTAIGEINSQSYKYSAETSSKTIKDITRDLATEASALASKLSGSENNDYTLLSKSIKDNPNSKPQGVFNSSFANVQDPIESNIKKKSSSGIDSSDSLKNSSLEKLVSMQFKLLNVIYVR